MDEQNQKIPMTDTETVAPDSPPAAASVAAPKKKRLRGCLFIVLKVFLVLFVIALVLDVFFKGAGFQKTWGSIGRRNLHVQELHYTLSPDRKEIVVSYELSTVKYDLPFWRPYIASSRPAETRISLDPMPDDVVKCFVEVVADPNAVPSHKIWLGTNGGDRTPLTYFKDNLEANPDDPYAVSDYFRGIPDGLNCRLTIRPEDESLLSEGVICSIRGRGVHVLLIPYEMDGDRHVMLSDKDTSDRPFFRQIRKEHPEIDTTTYDTGFLTYCKKLFWLPLGVLFDMIFYPIVFSVMIFFVVLMGRNA